MDNASKALIMAGAILIAVALVSLGVYLYQSAANSVSDSSAWMDSTKVETQNAKFEKYAGPNVKGPEVKSLIRAVGTFNANDIWPDDIKMDLKPSGDTGATTSDLANKIQDREYYNVEMTTYDSNYGYLTQITITKK